MKSKLLTICVVAAIVFAAGTVWATDYYVATTGDDVGGDGTQGNPWQTIQYAIGQCTGSETIHVAPGDYTENVLINVEGLTLESSVQYGAKIIGTVTIGGAHYDASNAVLERFDIEGNVHIWDHDNVTVAYNKVTASGSNGICYTHGSSSGGTVTHNVVSAPGKMGICLDHDGGTFTVSHNTVEARKAIMFGTLSGGQIEYNTISSPSSDCDIEVWDASIVTAHYNNLLGAVWNSDNPDKPWTVGDTLDATYNWWGDLDPSDQVSGDVDYDPWLTRLTPMSKFEIEKAKVEYKEKEDATKVDVKGVLDLDLINGDGVDISEDVIVDVVLPFDTVSETIPGGTMVIGKHGEWKYKRPKDGAGNIKKMKIDWSKGKIDLKMDGLLPFTGDPNPLTVSIQIGDDIGEQTVTLTESLRKPGKWEYKLPKPPRPPKPPE